MLLVAQVVRTPGTTTELFCMVEHVHELRRMSDRIRHAGLGTDSPFDIRGKCDSCTRTSPAVEAVRESKTVRLEMLEEAMLRAERRISAACPVIAAAAFMRDSLPQRQAVRLGRRQRPGYCADLRVESEGAIFRDRLSRHHRI